MRVAGITVFAAELAAPVRVDGPLERLAWLGAVENAARGNFKILHAAFGLEQFALGGQPGNPHECHILYVRFLFASLQEKNSSLDGGKRRCHGNIEVLYTRENEDDN